MNRILNTFVLTAAVALVLTASCNMQPDGLQFKTVETEDFVKHPKGTEEYHGLKYKVSFTYPSRYADKAVLKTLQQQFVKTLQSWYFQNPDDEPAVDYASMSPEKALNAIIDSWKAKYDEDTKSELDEPLPEWATSWELNYNNTIPFVNETLLQLRTETYQYVGGAHGSTWFRCYLFNLQTGEEYSRDDIFKPESAARIQRLLLVALLNYWEEKSPYDIGLMEDEIWTENTDFALTPEGITFIYSDYELGSYALGCAEVTIPYAKILPHLREGAPVWYVAKELTSDNPLYDIQEIDEFEFRLLLDEIYYSLPAAYMPDCLKTDEQRREAEVSQENDIWEYLKFDGGGGHEKWNMAAYLTEDNRNVVLIVQYGGGLDGFVLLSDKTLNYHIETGHFAEIERPVDPFTVEEMIDETLFDNPKLAAAAKAYFVENQKLYYREFNRKGFTVIVDFFDFWLDNEDFDYYDYNHVIAFRKWDGKRFVKHGKHYLHDDYVDIW